MSPRRIGLIWLISLVVATVILNPIKAPTLGMGVGPALALPTPTPKRTPTATRKPTPTATRKVEITATRKPTPTPTGMPAPLSGTFTQHCTGYLVSNIDSPATCVAGPTGSCNTAGIHHPELDFLETIGVFKYSASSVSGNADAVELAINPSAGDDNMFFSEFGITVTGPVGKPPGAPTGCFNTDTTGSVPAGPTTKVCFEAKSEGCPSDSGSHYATNSTLTSLGVGTTATPCSSVPKVKSPLNLQCEGERM